MKIFLWSFFILLCMIAGGALSFIINYIRFTPLLKPKTKINPIMIDADYSDTIAQKLAALVRCRTISSGKKQSDNTDAAFENMRQALLSCYPNLHRTLRVKIIDNSLIYHWKGRSTELNPVLFLAHQDVVDAPGDGWEHPPFDGVIDKDFLYGRGAIDCKNVIATLFEAVETLLMEGFEPENDFYFALGHDEELGGREGAGKIVDMFKERGILFEAVYDEGGYIALDLKEFTSPVALVATSEKGLMNVMLTARAQTGHASRPSGKNAVTQLSEAIVRLEKFPLPYRIVPTTIEALHRASFHLTNRARFVVSNLWFFKRLFFKSITGRSMYNALFRTTVSPTMLRAGTAHNTLPAEAAAILNIRLLEGDLPSDIEAYLKGLLRGLDIDTEVLFPTRPRRVPHRIAAPSA